MFVCCCHEAYLLGQALKCSSRWEMAKLGWGGHRVYSF